MPSHRNHRRSQLVANACRCEPLESRRLLAVFDGTDNVDIIRITQVGNVTHVNINGTNTTTTDNNVQVRAKAGNDTIEFQGSLNKELIISGDAGNDTFRLAAGVGLQDCRGTTSVSGGPDNDTLILSDTNPSSQDIREYRFFFLSAAPFFGYGNSPGASQGVIRYDLESFVLDQNDAATTTLLERKPLTTNLQLNAGGGNDSVRAGDGELVFGGFSIASTSLSGGAGTDSITFFDSLDAEVPTTYNLGVSTFTRSFAALTYSLFEAQTLLPGAGDVNINSVSSEISNTTISSGGFSNGLPGRIVNIGQGDLAAVNGTVTVDAPGAVVTINDQNATAPLSTYNFTASQLHKIGRPVIAYSAFPDPIHSLRLNASNSPDTINVSGLEDVGLTVNTLAGSTNFMVENGGFGSFGPYVFNGGAGTNDSLTITNPTDNLSSTQVLTSTAFISTTSFGERTINYGGYERLTINEGNEDTTLAINSVAIPTTLNGGNGNDTFHLFNGSMINNFTANLTLNAGGGEDAVNLLGQSDGSSGRYDFTNQNQFRFGEVNTPKILTFNNLERVALQTSSAGDNINVTSTSVALTLLSGSGNDVISISNFSGLVSPFPITVNTGPEQTSFGGGDDLTVGGAPVVIEQSDAVRNLSVNGTLRITNGAVLTRVPPLIDFLPLNLTGVIDLDDGALLWRGGGQTPDFRAMLTSGYNNGAWNGTSSSGAINSSLAAGPSQIDAVGYGLGSEIAVSSLGGFTIAPGDTLLRYTFYGDADLNQTVDFDDFVRTDLGFNTGRIGWTNGDFDFNNTVDFDDFVLIDLAFNTQ